MAFDELRHQDLADPDRNHTGKQGTRCGRDGAEPLSGARVSVHDTAMVDDPAHVRRGAGAAGAGFGGQRRGAAKQRRGKDQHQQAVAELEGVAVRAMRDQGPETAEGNADGGEGKRAAKVDQAPAEIAEERRSEPETLRQQRSTEGGDGALQRILGSERREDEQQDGREQCRSSDPAEGRRRRHADRHREHEPIERPVQFPPPGSQTLLFSVHWRADITCPCWRFDRVSTLNGWPDEG